MDLEQKIDKILEKLQETDRKLQETDKKLERLEKEKPSLAAHELEKIEKLEGEESKLEAEGRMEIERLRRQAADAAAELESLKHGKKRAFLPSPTQRLAMLIIAIIVAAAITGVYFLFHAPASSYQTPSTAYRGWFLGPIGEPLNASFISGIENLGPQQASIGQEELSGKIVYQKPGIYNTSIGPQSFPGAFVMTYGTANNDYAIIPMRINPSFPVPRIDNTSSKPTVLFISAQGSPYSAVERYVLAIALSMFGNFSRLYYGRSATDAGNISTFLWNFSSALFSPWNSTTSNPNVNSSQFFTGAAYTSPYINFEPLELVGSVVLNTPGILTLEHDYSSLYNNVINYSNYGFHYASAFGYHNDIPAANGFGIANFTFGGVPFIDIANKFVIGSENVNPGAIFSNVGLYGSQEAILASLQAPVAQSFGEAALGAANVLAAEICIVINSTAPACSIPYMSQLVQKIDTLPYNSTEYA